MELTSYLQEKKKIIDQYLVEKLPSEQENPFLIHRSIRYSVLNGGKRLRPILTLMTAELLGKSYELVLPTAAGIELIHCFTLVHDDLPCMDDDDYRRGKLTNHKIFGEGMAVLTGDALLVMGLSFICQNAELEGVSKNSVILVLQNILDMLGTKKMLGGQVEDINWQSQNQNTDNIKDIYLKKTSALICASLEAGALLSQASEEQISALNGFGENIGLAFQITDDLLDLQQDKKGYDKPTYPAIFGVEKSRDWIQQYCRLAKESMSIFGSKADLFCKLVDYVQHRKE
ncbi:MAG: polyprenyl synthetase family protein [Atribacterota bacterium]|nr:polyprenyl synthetase family protein [Atribacterota bacterium]MDD4896842.1 polyprenyl synthetase family protein [Atribacterota bacterium]MDD5636238.1 polyprenyl synthetase family protein [Atribacterota bacterium]